MNIAACKDLLMWLDEDFTICPGKTDDKTAMWLQGAPIPAALTELLCSYWPRQSCYLRKTILLSASDIQSVEVIDRLLVRELLPIGILDVEQLLCVSFSDGDFRVGFTNESINEISSPRINELRFETIARSLESYLFRVAEDRYIPSSYQNSLAFNEFLRQESTYHAFPPYAEKVA